MTWEGTLRGQSAVTLPLYTLLGISRSVEKEQQTQAGTRGRIREGKTWTLTANSRCDTIKIKLVKERKEPWGAEEEAQDGGWWGATNLLEIDVRGEQQAGCFVGQGQVSYQELLERRLVPQHATQGESFQVRGSWGGIKE